MRSAAAAPPQPPSPCPWSWRASRKRLPGRGLPGHSRAAPQRPLVRVSRRLEHLPEATSSSSSRSRSSSVHSRPGSTRNTCGAPINPTCSARSSSSSSGVRSSSTCKCHLCMRVRCSCRWPRSGMRNSWPCNNSSSSTSCDRPALRRLVNKRRCLRRKDALPDRVVHHDRRCDVMWCDVV